MSEQRELSLRLNAILKMVGASEKMRKFHQRTAKKSDIAHAVSIRRPTGQLGNVYYCGSFYEGTVTPDLASDVDVILCFPGLLVVPHRLMAGPDKFLHIVREAWTRPGYAKLQWMRDGRPITVHDHIVANKHIGFDIEGRACLKHYNGGRMQGPAIMQVDEQGRHIMDTVYACQCKGIPLFATDWITRHRRFDWPSQELIGELKMMGSLFVGVGHFNSHEKDLEWRLSFSLQERRLMKSLNPTQHRVYILLKMTKCNILEKYLKEETVSSYHCKTCVFYTVESTPASMWVPENLINCLLQCLIRLLQWVRDKFCPNFFLKDSNLFDKEGFFRHMDQLDKLLCMVLQTGHKFLYLLQSDHVGHILRHEHFSFYKPITDSKVRQYIALTKFEFICAIHGLCRQSPSISSAGQDLLTSYMAELDEYEHGDGVLDYTHDEAQPALRYILPWLHLCIGLEFATRVVKCPDKHEGKELMVKVDYHLQQARNTDLVNVRLAQTTILLRLGKLEECFMLLQELDNCWMHRVVTACPCTKQISPMKFNDEYQVRELYSAWSSMPTKKLARTYLASCIIFERSQEELVPRPLRYEMYRSLFTPPGSRDMFKDAWFDRAAVDAKVYLYLLQYLVCSKLNREPHKQIAITSLARVAQYGPRGRINHRDTSYNLLGWVYLQEDRVEDALWCFHQSWKIRPYHNAAKFHMFEVFFRMIERRSEE